MLFCAACSREMKCQTNGVQVHFGHGHCYAGDLYKCKECGVEIVTCNQTPWQASDAQLAAAKKNGLLYDAKQGPVLAQTPDEGPETPDRGA